MIRSLLAEHHNGSEAEHTIVVNANPMRFHGKKVSEDTQFRSYRRARQEILLTEPQPSVEGRDYGHYSHNVVW